MKSDQSTKQSRWWSTKDTFEPEQSSELLRKVTECESITPWQLSYDVSHAVGCLFCLDVNSLKETLSGSLWQLGPREHLMGFLNATALSIKYFPSFEPLFRQLNSSPIAVGGRTYYSYHEAAVKLCERRFRSLDILYRQVRRDGGWSAQQDPTCSVFGVTLLDHWEKVQRTLNDPSLPQLAEVELRDLREVFLHSERNQLEKVSLDDRSPERSKNEEGEDADYLVETATWRFLLTRSDLEALADPQTPDGQIAVEVSPGPLPPGAFCWEGKVYSHFHYRGKDRARLSEMPFLLLSLLWNHRHEGVELGQIRDHVWRDENAIIDWGSVRNHRKPIDAFFREHGIPFVTEIVNGRLILLPVQK